MRRRFGPFVLLLVAALALVPAASAFAANPPASPANLIPTESFEGAYPSYLTVEPVYPISPSKAWWAPITNAQHSGSRALWCAGSSPSLWPEYPTQSGGEAVFSVPQAADYYSTQVSFWYLMPSVGSDDGNAFSVSCWDPADFLGTLSIKQGLATFPLTSGWRSSAWDVSSGAMGLSRRPVDVRFKWYDGDESANQASPKGQGPSIDDVSIGGWKYGPVRSLSAVRSGDKVELAWQKPFAAVGSTTVDTRPMSFRVWRSAVSDPDNWVELPGNTVTGLSYTDAFASGAASRYLVQAWDPVGAGYGVWATADVSADPALDGTPPSTSVQLPAQAANGWFRSDVTVQLAAVDSGGAGVLGTFCAVGSGEEQPTAGTLSASSEGVTTFLVYSLDNRYNKEHPKTITVSIDKTPPVSTASVAGGKVTITATDAGSGVDRIAYDVDGGAAQTYVTPFSVPAGTHTVHYYAIDKAGNAEAARPIAATGTGSATIVVEPVAGADRYATAIAAVQKAFPAGAQTVVIAYGRNFPDALGAAALCGAKSSPLLLTETSYIPAAVRDEIKRLKATKAVIIGSESVVSAAVAADLKTLTGAVPDRVAGPDRYATASQVALAAAGGTADDVFLAVGENFPDALAASPAAYAKRWPILLTRKDALPTSTLAALQSLKPKRIHVLGSAAAVADPVVAAARTATAATADRWAGANRYATAVDIATKSGLAFDGVALATGENFPDALAGGVMQGRLGSVVLLTQTSVLSADTKTALAARKAQIHTVRYLGSAAAVSQAVRDQVTAALK